MSDPEFGFIPDGIKDQEMHKRFEVFQQSLENIIDQTVANPDMDDPDFIGVPFEVSPESLFLQVSDEMGAEVDERTFNDLSAVEQGTVIELLSKKLGISLDKFFQKAEGESSDLREQRHRTTTEGVVLDESIDEHGMRQFVIMKIS